jgi:hypothetical protein
MMKKIFNLRNVVAIATCLAAMAACKKDEPKFKIVELSFGRLYELQPQSADVENALKSGADSVYLVSTEDFELLSQPGRIANAGGLAVRLTSISPRVRGRGVINPNIEVAAKVPPEYSGMFEACGFKYIPGYVKPK